MQEALEDEVESGACSFLRLNRHRGCRRRPSKRGKSGEFASCSRELGLGAAKSTMISPIDRGSALDRTRSIESGFLREHPAQRSTRSNVARLAAGILAAILSAILSAIIAAIIAAQASSSLSIFLSRASSTPTSHLHRKQKKPFPDAIAKAARKDGFLCDNVTPCHSCSSFTAGNRLVLHVYMSVSR